MKLCNDESHNGMERSEKNRILHQTFTSVGNANIVMLTIEF